MRWDRSSSTRTASAGCSIPTTAAACRLPTARQALPTTCAIFPRTALAVGDRIEVGGSLGCPEVARLVLLSTDELAMRPARQPMLTRDYVGKTVGGGGADPYAEHFSSVRELLMSCFRRNVSLGTRLVLAADFAHRVRDLLHTGTAAFDGARRPFAERTLRAEIDETASPALLASLDGDLAALDAPGDATASLIATWLVERKRLPHSAALRGAARRRLRVAAFGARRPPRARGSRAWRRASSGASTRAAGTRCRRAPARAAT